MAERQRALLVAAALWTGLSPPCAWQHNSRNAKHVKMMVPHPSSSPELSAAGTAGAVVPASWTTPSRTEAAKEEETLKSLMGILEHVMQHVPTQDAPAQHSAVTPALNDTLLFG